MTHTPVRGSGDVEPLAAPAPVAVSVLGELLLTVDGADVTPSAPKERQLLGLLVLGANRLVTRSAIVRELWHERPPKSARTTLQTYVLHLRKLLGPRAVRLVTRPGGYALDLDGDDVDVRRFEVLARSGRGALAAGDAPRAAEGLGRALLLWRDAALVDVEHGPVLGPQVHALEEHRLLVLEHRIEADLALGRGREVLVELASLTAEHPFHEPFHEHYMRALDAAGRRSEALAIFHRIRRALREELALDPSALLERAHRDLLGRAGA